MSTNLRRRKLVSQEHKQQRGATQAVYTWVVRSPHVRKPPLTVNAIVLQNKHASCATTVQKCMPLRCRAHMPRHPRSATGRIPALHPKTQVRHRKLSASVVPRSRVCLTSPQSGVRFPAELHGLLRASYSPKHESRERQGKHKKRFQRSAGKTAHQQPPGEQANWRTDRTKGRSSHTDTHVSQHRPGILAGCLLAWIASALSSRVWCTTPGSLTVPEKK